MRNRIQPIFKYRIFGNYKKQTLNSIKKKNLLTIGHFLFHTTVLQYTQSRIHRPKLRNKNCSFIFCWIRNNNFGFGSRQKFRIHADPDPDPQHCFCLYCRCRWFLWCAWIFSPTTQSWTCALHLAPRPVRYRVHTPAVSMTAGSRLLSSCCRDSCPAKTNN